MLNKDLIKNNFQKSILTYDENAIVQEQMAQFLCSKIQKQKYNKILEIGSYTGKLTKLAVKKFDFDSYVALDVVNSFDFIKNLSPKISFIQSDIEKFETSDKFDLIISNATLQWISDFKGVINSLRECLNPQGELVFSTFGNENFREIYHAIGTTLNYYSLSELREMFPNSTIEPEIHIMAFESPKDVLKHLQLTGVNAIENKAWTKKDLLNFENGYTNLCVKRPTLTYNPVYIRILSPVG